MSQQKYRVYICCGRNCGPKGSRRLVDDLEDEIERLSLHDRVRVYPGGCQNHCESGPTMVIYPGPVFYQEVDRQRIRRIAVEHLANNVPVTEYFWVDTGAYKPVRPHKVVFSPPLQHPKPAPPQEHIHEKKQKPKKSYDVDDFKW